jgi:hypothetical protein
VTRFRVTAGADLVRRTKAVLEPFIDLPDLRVEAEPGVLRGAAANGTKILVAGKITGRREAGGRLRTLESPRRFVEALVDDHPAAQWNRHFDGDAVILAVATDGSVTISADRFGKRDIYVQSARGGVSLASDLSLLAENPARDGYDAAALAHSMTYYGHRPPKRHTMYKAVRRLGVGDVAHLRAGKLDVERTPFKPLPMEEYRPEAIDRYTDAFLDYIAAAGSDQGNHIFLSSGWDSSSILSALVHVFGAKRVTGIIGRMFYSERSGHCNRFETDRATKIAEHYGIKLHTVDLDYVKAEPEWTGRVLEAYRAHNVQSFTGLNHAHLAQGAAELDPTRPVFAGETSDGAHNLGFSQYVTIFHPTQGFREYSDKMASYLFGPTFVRELLEGRHEQDAVYRLFRERAAGVDFDDVAAAPEQRMRQMFVSFFLRNGRLPLWSGRNVRMLTRDGMERYTETMANEYFAGVESATPDVLYSWYLELYNSFHWQGSTVSTVQKLGDLFGLTAHHPYWAAGIQDFLQAMPESWGRGLELNPTKYPLKRMLREKLGHPMEMHGGPHSYTYDVDPTFNHSFELMHHSRFGKHAKAALARKDYHQVLDPASFDLAYIDDVVDRFVRGEEQRGGALNDLVSVWLLCQSGWYA